ncbi:hypothetical protein EDD85DRAFT_788481 [Armillaria nabsnona]|nr:hypothetical protein EDD85DRAFT_788481 [Armillaria nabsnona]
MACGLSGKPEADTEMYRTWTCHSVQSTWPSATSHSHSIPDMKSLLINASWMLLEIQTSSSFQGRREQGFICQGRKIMLVEVGGIVNGSCYRTAEEKIWVHGREIQSVTHSTLELSHDVDISGFINNPALNIKVLVWKYEKWKWYDFYIFNSETQLKEMPYDRTCQIDQNNLHKWSLAECVGVGKAISNITLELKS